MALAAIDPQITIQAVVSLAAGVLEPWVPLISASANFLTSIIFAYTTHSLHAKYEQKAAEDDKLRKKEFDERKKEMEEGYELRTKKFEERFAEQSRKLEEKIKENHRDEEKGKLKGGEYRRYTEDSDIEELLEKNNRAVREEIGKKLEKDQKKRAKEEKQRRDFFDEIKPSLSEQQEKQNQQLAQSNERHQLDMERYFIDRQERHLATVLKNSDVTTKLNELGDLIGLYQDYGKRYASNPQKMIAETERYQQHLGIQLKRVSKALIRVEADVRLLNIWLNGAAHHIQILRHLGREGLESLDSVRAAVEIHWDEWKRLSKQFSSDDEKLQEIERFFDGLYHSKNLLNVVLDPILDGNYKIEL